MRQPCTGFLESLRERVLVFDGAMGTSLQRRDPTLDDYQGLEGCSEILCASRPDWIRAVHESFLAAGCDAVETNTFGANAVVLAEYGIAGRVEELNATAARLAREVAAGFSTPERGRFVVGSIGPGTKLVSLGQVPFDALLESYRRQVRGLLDGGVDALLIETCQDLLQAKTAVIASFDVMGERRVRIPVMVQVTVETTGTMLLGTEILAAETALSMYPVDVLGMNCATGPRAMRDHVQTLARATDRFVSCQPNAGLPENVGGVATYRLTPRELADELRAFVTDFGVEIVGGCCGTTPDHLAEVVRACGGLTPRRERARGPRSASSLYTQVTYRQEPPPLIIGERTNANGSRKFKRLLALEEYDALASMGKEQAREGAHVLDVCTAYVGRNEIRDMTETVRRMVASVPIPLMIDSTEAPVIEEALKWIGGKALINSINLEDGEERMEKVCPLARRYGAGVVALTIDETGMAKTAARKVEVAERILGIAVRKHGLDPSDLIFDCLTFTLGSGDGEFRRAGVETIDAIRELKRRHPEVSTVLGISNISFGLDPALRQVLNSVFLHYAVEAGLDMAIVNAEKIEPLHTIDAEGREMARRLVFDDRTGGDPLHALMAHYAGAKATARVRPEPATLEEKIQRRVIDGEREGIGALLDEALKRREALPIINEVLLPAMKTVGELMASGQMQLPFVLQAAEVMKLSVKHLEPHMEKSGGVSRGKIVLATVKGDVHDIGKNLVDIILSNNGFTTFNLGIKQPIESILLCAQEKKCDAIGMSGLLVKSTAVMLDNLHEMRRRGIDLPVLCGGAALTRGFVERDLREAYAEPVFYCRDAFEGLRVMEGLADGAKRHALLAQGCEVSGGRRRDPRVPDAAASSGAEVPQTLERAEVPKAPFLGSRVVEKFDLDEVFRFINPRALFRGQWQYRQGTRTAQEYEAELVRTVRPLFEELKRKVIAEGLFHPRVAYGYFRCGSEGDALHVEGEGGGRVTFPFPRQKGGARRCIADFFRPCGEGGAAHPDLVGFSLVTIGEEATVRSQDLFRADRYADYLHFHGLSVETAEALAEFWHSRMRRELSIHAQDAPAVEGLFRQGYRGSRYSFGYPACPNLEDQAKLFTLLKPERIGVRLTETFQLEPEQSTSAIVVHHPQARYFAV
ncbi:MAG: methionine synthase [Planctomycetes bacterium]|nr:methionine synthase [Planctomycetota bacterium]